MNPHNDDWNRLIPAIRSTPGVKVITLNHPRDLHNGFTPLDDTQFNASTGKHLQAEALKGIDAIEVITSGATQSDLLLLYRDWFALLNHGHRIAAIGSSDSHDVSRYILGQGRTYVAVDDTDPAHVPLDDAWRSYREGRLLVSMGLLAELRLNDQFKVGDLATISAPTIKFQSTILGTSWVTADHVALYANGGWAGVAVNRAGSEESLERERMRMGSAKAPRTVLTPPANDGYAMAALAR